MSRLWLALVFLCAPAIALAVEPRKVEIARVDSQQGKSVEIVSQRISPNGKMLWIELKPSERRFTVDFDFTFHKFDRVKITIQGMKKLDIARYQTDYNRAKASIDLKDSPAVRIEKDGDNTVIDFLIPRSAHVLGPEGRLLIKEVSGGDEKPPAEDDRP